MIRKRDFKLSSKTNLTSWPSFKEAIAFLTKKQKEIEHTFDVSEYDYTFNEPMNVIVLECDHNNPDVPNIMEYAKLVNNIFADKSDKIVIDVRVSILPTKRKNRVYIEHTWFFKETL
jgi:hypothetical protein